MHSSQTAQSTQNSGKSTSPFDQIKELERREKERVEIELSGMHKEKEEVSHAIAKKEEASAEEMKVKAKKELKAYSESDLPSIVSKANKEAEDECARLESAYAGKKKSAVDSLVNTAKDPTVLFPDHT